MDYIILLVLIAIALFSFAFFKKYYEERKKQRDAFNALYPQIEFGVKEFQKLTSRNRGYFANYDLEQWKLVHSPTYVKLKNINYKSVIFSEELLMQTNLFVLYMKEGEPIRGNYNKEFVEYELEARRTFFSHIEECGLDPQQSKAVVIDEDNNLIIAGAGSGKTTTIAGKVSYLVRRGIKPEDILLIAFTGKARDAMQQRIKIKQNLDIDVMTFHKFGIEVIRSVENVRPGILDGDNFRSLIDQIFREKRKDAEFAKRLNSFFLDLLKEPKSIFDFNSKQEQIAYLKDKNYCSYKMLEYTARGSDRISLKRELLKSIEEVRIANFLFFNRIEYKYENPYKYNTGSWEYRQYKPDFYLPDYDIYIEHFAIDRNKNVPRFFAKKGGDEAYKQARKKYVDGINWKRKLHKTKKTKLVETFSYEMREGNLLDSLEKKLKACGVTFNPMSPEEIWAVIKTNAKDEAEAFRKLICTFLVLMKSNNCTIKDVDELIKKLESGFLKNKAVAFMGLFSPIFNEYEARLKSREEIDFSDMINKATSYINSGNFKSHYKYIIIDEFQDISFGRYELVKALKNSNPASKLFCVGDDWQSIYRFAGSDIKLFTKFESFFGCTAHSRIERTYRYGNPLLATSGDFILKNPNQTVKELRPKENKKTELEILYSEKYNNELENVVHVLETLKSDNEDIYKKEILILGRYSFDQKRLNYPGSDSSPFKVKEIDGEKRLQYEEDDQLKIKFMTIHKAKGLEADYVIVLNCNSGKYGFPSQLSDDELLTLLLSNADQFENGEERRVFYVAITRAKEKVFLIGHTTHRSKFIKELENKNSSPEIEICTNCKDGLISLKQGVSRHGKAWAFKGCSNWNYGCEFQEWLKAEEVGALSKIANTSSANM